MRSQSPSKNNTYTWFLVKDIVMILLNLLVVKRDESQIFKYNKLNDEKTNNVYILVYK